MRDHLERQADAIEWVLWSHRVQARVAGGTVGPRLVRFYLHPAPGVRVSRLLSLTEELALALDTPACRITRQGGQVVLELPRTGVPAISLHTLAGCLGHDNVPRETALLGLDEEGQVLGLRLSSPDVAHVLVAGTTGSGKTALLQVMILSLAQHNPVAALQLVLIDPQGRGLGALAALPHVRDMVTEPAASAAALAGLVDELEERARRRVAFPRLVVVIDELADIAGVAVAARESLTRLVSRGRGMGIHVVAATQKPTTAAVGSLVQANFPTRIVGRVASAADARVAAGRGGLGAESLLGRGDFLLVGGGTVARFQGAYEDPAAVRSLVQQIARVPDELPLLAATGTEGLGGRAREAMRRGWQIVK
ncbi:MAG: DNA translocase FtsK [Chloroflexi bacterium]|nr:DNA translocase FtsK [Chloroflexota bacterium]MBU1747901.1 DNA translocase FtsK [Chloroflexota bacterium]